MWRRVWETERISCFITISAINIPWSICGRWMTEESIWLVMCRSRRSSRREGRSTRISWLWSWWCWWHFYSAAFYITWIIGSSFVSEGSGSESGKFTISSWQRLCRRPRLPVNLRPPFFPICPMISARPWMRFWDLPRCLPRMPIILQRCGSTPERLWHPASIFWAWSMMCWMYLRSRAGRWFWLLENLPSVIWCPR